MAIDMEGLGLAGIVALLFVKEAGVPIPVPGDLVVLGAGIAAAHGDLPPAAVIAIVAATILGGTVQFLLVRGRGRRLVLRVLALFGVAEAGLERAAARLRGRGVAAVALARMTPGLRIVAIPAGGLAGLPVPAVVGGLAIGNSVFTGAHFAAGYAVGEPAVRLLSGALGAVALGAVALVGFAALGAVGWWLVRQRRAARLQIADWADAACPACLVLAAVAPAEPA